MNLKNIILKARNWFSDTSERALQEAYQAALTIKKIEDEHFGGKKISPSSSEYGASVNKYFETELNKNLQVIKMRLVEFKTSDVFLAMSGLNKSKNQPSYAQKNVIIEKVKFIDTIASKYEKELNNSSENQLSLIDIPEEIPVNKKEKKVRADYISSSKNKPKEKPKLDNIGTVTDKTGVLPRSFLTTLKRIRQEIDPKSEETEEEVIQKFRRARYKTAISIKFILILIIVPLLTHNVAKILMGNSLVEPYFAKHEQILFINQDLEEEAFTELKRFEERLHFQSLIGLGPELSEGEIKEELQHKADEIAEEYRYRGVDAIENIIADLFSLLAFGIVIFVSKKELAILKSFLDEMIYGLSDSAKAFLIILFTDIFVGYHSPHGWEVILEGVSRHFGLPENREFNFLFIATFPVILDTVLKYWIFRYLNRISPSAVATYRNMNE